MLQGALESIQKSSEFGEQAYTVIFSILIAGAGASLWVRKKISADSLEVKSDTMAGNLLQHLEDERDVLKEEKEKILDRLTVVEEEKNQAVALVGKLTVEVEHLSKQVNHLEAMVQLLSAKLDRTTDKMQEIFIDNVKYIERLANIKAMYELKCSGCEHNKDHHVD